MSSTTIGSEALVYKTCNWVGMTWRVLPRSATLFQPIVGDLIDSAQSLNEQGVPHKNPTDARIAMQFKLEHLRRRSVQENLWGGNPLFTKAFFELPDPGQREGFLAILLASIIANNLENPQVTFSKSELKDKLDATVKSREMTSTIHWLQTAWQCRFNNTLPESNASLKWEATVSAITDSVKELFGDKPLSAFSDVFDGTALGDKKLDALRRKIHDKMRAQQLWKDDKTGVVYHDVDFYNLRYSDNPEFGLPFMEDNYTILALVGLIPKSEYKIVE